MFRAQADRAETSLSALIRHAVLNQKPPRASQQPSAIRKDISRLVFKLGELARALRDATEAGDQARIADQIEASHRDIADMCFACFKALGRNR